MALQFDLIYTREKGMVIPGWQHAFPATRRRGVTVGMREVVKPELGQRVITIATATWDEGSMELWDARVIEMTPDRLVIAGFERIDHLGVPYDYAQSWVLRPTSATP